jgi:hypothetical protein
MAAATKASVRLLEAIALLLGRLAASVLPSPLAAPVLVPVTRPLARPLSGRRPGQGSAR